MNIFVIFFCKKKQEQKNALQVQDRMPVTTGILS